MTRKARPNLSSASEQYQLGSRWNVMCVLVQEVPVLPVLAKADCMTTGELESFRELVRNTLHHVSMLQITVNIRI